MTRVCTDWTIETGRTFLTCYWLWEVECIVVESTRESPHPPRWDDAGHFPGPCQRMCVLYVWMVCIVYGKLEVDLRVVVRYWFASRQPTLSILICTFLQTTSSTIAYTTVVEYINLHGASTWCRDWFKLIEMRLFSAEVFCPNSSSSEWPWFGDLSKIRHWFIHYSNILTVDVDLAIGDWKLSAQFPCSIPFHSLCIAFEEDWVL